MSDTHANPYAAAFDRVFLKNRAARLLAYFGLAAWAVLALQGVTAVAVVLSFSAMGGGFFALAATGLITWYLVQNLVVGPSIVMIRAWVSSDMADKLQRWSNLWD